MGPGWSAPPPAKFADSFIRLVATREWPGLVEVAHFRPSNAKRLRDGDRDPQGQPLNPPDPNGHGGDHWGDTDLGSGGPVLLPGGRLIGGGKQGRYYIMDSQMMKLTQDRVSPDRDKVGEGFQAFFNQYRNVTGDAIDHFQMYGAAQEFGPNIHGGPVYWPGRGLIYQMPEKDFMKAFAYDELSYTVAINPVLKSVVKPPDGMPGGHSSLSANGEMDGVVWTTMPHNDDATAKLVPGDLIAFDAQNLSVIWSDPILELFAKFNPPTIADGKVFRAGL